ncbi:MAG: hypothetical protein ACK5M3_19105 [Dysgonomonas sp.]
MKKLLLSIFLFCSVLSCFGQDDKLPCIALPEKQEEITLEYLKTNLFHKREVHCLEDVNVEKRKELIGEIAKQTVIVGSDEDLLYNLILSTPQNQESDVFAYLKDKDLLSSIINDIQFTTHDEITFVFIDWLRKYNVAPITDQTKLVRYNGGKMESSISKNTNDVDMVAMIQQSEFDDIVKSFYNGKIQKNGANVDLSKMNNTELKKLAQDILNNKTSYNRIAYDDFRYSYLSQIINAKPDKGVIKGLKNLKEKLQSQYPHLKIENIAIQVKGQKFDLKPYFEL